uniref:Uncharacterized protein n=1 Tax=Aplanochytrium stocchinoi TaxID=215587 RepID=A0A7S3V2P3_9STRA|mmetsp:Transcript_13886/g.16114  ORF Transcript_13886/g.16114 Transcript_13886/m.16114 type:complete len:625 (+) Transcript_13886:224-2098(+)|eukprot:CAMPEP_0204833714 /NCGR_PEP_ID=MMETSP1346-20131115/17567_1 /ASSEMBLY_ACC=CAM_ASM_000771 /TAXON_ID=215587 /ORGANISM="Aplanochytrium stocchinoi, Strain GSBS06" /LENGTH=624 /DNA_ID=CAMNT_0051966447 /DNA_START=214 /DNA_END=2088 /DNA_ORIENTATION=-
MAGGKHTLHSKYPKNTGMISLMFLLGNWGLQVFSHVGLSAVIKSSATINDGFSFAADVCTGDANYSEFLDYFNNQGGGENFAFVQGGEDFGFTGCGVVYGLFGLDFLETCLRTDRNKTNGDPVPGYKGGDGCIVCYQASSECGRLCAFGAAQCAVDNDSPSCLDCIEEKGCNEIFEACANVTVPEQNNTRRLLHSFIPEDDFTYASHLSRERDLQSLPDEIQLTVVYEISFVSSLKDAYNGGAYGIFFVIFLFSGVWPYGKNCIMFVAWFVPMTWETRSWILKNLTRLAKWSLVDVFAIVIIMAGLRIIKPIVTDPNGAPLVIVAESRIAIYTFCVAAIWDLVQGEWMRHMHLRAYEKEIQKESGLEQDSTSSLNSGSNMIKEIRFSDNPKRSCSVPGKNFTIVFMLIQLALALSSVFLTVITYNLFGELFAEDSKIEYTAATIATTILSEEALKINDSPTGTVFLVVMYIALSIAIPIFQFGSIIILTFVGWDKACCNKSIYKTFFEAVDIIGGFACQDVFVLSFVVVIAEWDKLINTSVGNVAGDTCGEVACLGMTAEIGIGIYVMTVAFILGWICEMWITYAYSQLIHPVEKVELNNVFFGLVSQFGCTSAVDLEITDKHV